MEGVDLDKRDGGDALGRAFGHESRTGRAFGHESRSVEHGPVSFRDGHLP